MIVWAPLDNREVLSWACPLTRATVPKVVFPVLKVTFPVGTCAAAEETTAVNVTVVPVGAGFSEEDSDRLVAAFSTICCRLPELGAYAVPPLYEAVMVCVPLVIVEVFTRA